MVEDSRAKKIIAILVITFVLFVSLMSYADSYDLDYIENSEFVGVTEFSQSFDLPLGTYFLIFDTKGLLEDQIQSGEAAFITGNIQYLFRHNQNLHSNVSFTINMDSSETARYKFQVPNLDATTVITFSATDISSGVIMVENGLKELDRISFIIGIATLSFLIFIIALIYLAYHGWNIRKKPKVRGPRQISRADAENYGWYISGNISDKTFSVINDKKEVTDKILGVFESDNNKILILSNLHIKELDRGFLRTSYKFSAVRYPYLTEILRQSNCIFIQSVNKFTFEGSKSKYCLRTEEARDKAIEIILQRSDLENVTILPDIEHIKQKEKEERQRKVEERRQRRIESQQWQERQRRKRYARSIEKRENKKQQSHSPTACLGCGSNNPEDSNFCLTCGVSL